MFDNSSIIMLFIVAGPVTSISVVLQRTSAIISWIAPDYVPTNYPIITYEIGYYTSSLKRQVTLPERAVLHNTSSSPYTINNLQLQTSYVFAMRAYTIFGPGEWVQVMKETQIGDKPSGIHVTVAHCSTSSCFLAHAMQIGIAVGTVVPVVVVGILVVAICNYAQYMYVLH